MESVTGSQDRYQAELAPSGLRGSLVVKLLLISILGWALYNRILADLANDWWTEPALSQGLLIPPLALAVAWLRWPMTARIPAAIDYYGLLVVAGSSLMYMAGHLAAEFFLSRMSFVVLVAGLIWTFWGMGRLKSLMFPVVLLATMVPLPSIVYNTISAPLQMLATRVATSIAQMAGVTVFRDGNLIHLAQVTLGVEEACSGLGSLTTLIVAGVMVGFLMTRRPSTRVIVLLSAVPIAIATNVLRVAGTAILADYKLEMALGFYHSFSGWLVFLAGLSCLYLTALVLTILIPEKR